MYRLRQWADSCKSILHSQSLLYGRGDKLEDHVDILFKKAIRGRTAAVDGATFTRQAHREYDGLID